MTPPADHAQLLAQRGYPVPRAAVLSDGERQIVDKFGFWMEALTVGAISPTTPDQERFVRVARGEEPPRSAFEQAWAKCRPPESTAVAASRPSQQTMTHSLPALARQLEETRAAALAVQQEYAFRKLDVMARVQPELDAIEAEMGPQLKASQEAITRLETALKEGVRQNGRSFVAKTFKVTYSRGRVTFDSTAMQQYALTHPEVDQFRKVGQPIVSLRYTGATEPVAPPAEEHSTASAGDTSGR